jgi:hypothetical protein
MHTQHVKFSTYVAWGGGVVRVVAVGVVFEEGEDEMAAGLEDEDIVDGSMFEPVVVVACFLPSPLFFVLLLVLLLDFIGTIYRGFYVVTGRDHEVEAV